ncbi:MAG: phosphatidate cytidylyltransferase [Betaproteobacteria bacterium]|nr:phosphatidate cytidylyltransferase [Betaproteobacteria bacterium]
MLKQRLLTVAVALPVILLALFAAPATVWGGLLGFVSLIAAWEWSKLAGMSTLVSWAYMIIFAAAGMATYALEVTQPGGLLACAQGVLGYLLAIAFWVLWVPLWLRSGWRITNPWYLGVFGIVALIPLWHALFVLHAEPWKLLALMAVVWVADTAAYAFGRMFGRRKLAPSISPGKTWEGVAGAAVMVLLYVYGLATMYPDAFPGVLPMLGLGVLMLVLGIEGDLLESWLKRVAGVKDSGNLLPGHGGVLDRIDALAGAMPIAVFVLWLMRSHSSVSNLP